MTQDTSSEGTLDKETFIQVVRQMVQDNDDPPVFFTGRNIFFIFITAWSGAL